MSLYQDLGLGPDATPAEIKKAHRRLVKEHHPDAGGDREKFERVQKAVAVLSDPTRRERYDRTGEAPDINPEDSLEMKAMSALSARLNVIISAAQIDPRYIDVVIVMRDSLREEQRQVKTGIQEIETKKKRLEQFQKRLARKAKADGVDRLGPIMEAQQQTLNALIQTGRDQLAVLEAAIEMAGAYTYKVDQQPMATMGRPGTGSWMNGIQF